jgi:hypothetical protein
MEIVMDSAGHSLTHTPISAQVELFCPRNTTTCPASTSKMLELSY